MTPFIVLATLLVAGALLLVLPPLFGWGRQVSADRADQVATALSVLREQLAELDSELAAGRLSEATHTSSRDELERRALEEGLRDNSDEAVRPVSDRARNWALAVLVGLPAAAAAFYLLVGNPEGLDPSKVAGAHEEVSPEQINQMVATLAARMEKDPNNPEGWAMLARSYTMLGRADEAVAAYRQLAELMPDDAQVQADWADAMGSANGNTLIGAPEKPIARALELDPRNIKALALAGSLAFEKADYVAAARHWEAILVQVPPEEEKFASAIRGSIAEARKKGGMPPMTEVTSAPFVSSTASHALAITGEVRLAPALADKAKPEDVVFVFARPPAGGRPLAALRYTVAQLPVRFDFSGATSMAEGGQIPDRIVLGARISKSGNPRPAPGDLEGLSDPLAPNASNVVLTIDGIRP